MFTQAERRIMARAPPQTTSQGDTPMRIAFASCMNAQVFPQQPVWGWIAAQQPDHLVLLGDSIYLDVPINGPHPQDMTDDEFAQHLHARYSAQLQQPAFAALVQGLPGGRVWTVWDDHDFLWNDARGADVAKSPLHREKIRLSTAFHRVFRQALAARLVPGAFPAAYNEATFWNAAEPALAVPSIALEPKLWLHLTDGRTYRSNPWPPTNNSACVLLGSAQRKTLATAMGKAPNDAVHLLASGSPGSAYRRDYEDDWLWLLGQAQQRRVLMLSGDIHRNDSAAAVSGSGGFPLHEATSSGAAVKTLVSVGKRRRNFGMLDVTANELTIRLVADNAEEAALTRRLRRADWMPV
jgi:alkaline phosphatase D